MLSILHPEVATRSCQSCKDNMYDERTGQLRRNPITGKPVPRVEGTVLRCQMPEGCPMGTPENRKALSDKNLLALSAHQQYAAVGRFPIDRIAEHNAGLIRTAEGIAERALQWEQLNLSRQTNELLALSLKARSY